VLEAIVGYDARDAEATRKASQYIPEGGYRQSLKIDGLRGKRLGILRKDFFRFPLGSVQEKVFSEHFAIIRYFASISSWNYLLSASNTCFLEHFPSVSVTMFTNTAV
jgi:amidase